MTASKLMPVTQVHEGWWIVEKNFGDAEIYGEGNSPLAARTNFFLKVIETFMTLKGTESLTGRDIGHLTAIESFLAKFEIVE